MKTLLALLAILTLNFSALSAGIDSSNLNAAGFDKLTEAQKAEIVKSVEAQAVQGDAKSTAAKVNEWVDVGTKIGQGLAGAAKETGVAVNEFAKTPVGMLTTVLIVWKMVGSTIVHLGLGFLIWAGGFPVVNMIWKRAHTENHFDKEGKLTHSKVDTIDGDSFIAYILANAIIFLTGLIVALTF